MNKNIELHETSTDPITDDTVSPWTAPAKSNYQDLLLKSEFAAMRYKFPVGTTWLRIVDAFPNSDKRWILGIHTLNYDGGRHAHPKTIIPSAKSVFDHAYGWLKENAKESLYSKSNKNGHRLLADPLYLFWMIVEENGKSVARLVLASGYNGSRGGAPGLGHQIWALTQERDEDGNLIGDATDSESGVQICVEKKQAPGARYPSYTLRMGRVPAPIEELYAKMDPVEVAAITPLVQVVHLPDKEEEWKLLENVIDADTVDKIRASAV